MTEGDIVASGSDGRLSPHVVPASIPQKCLIVKTKPARKRSTTSPRKKQGKRSSVKRRSRPKADNSQVDIRIHFPVIGRRKTSAQKQKEREENISQLVKSNKDQPGLEKFDAGEKGRGVKVTKVFERNDFVCEYAGKLLTEEEGREKEEEYDAEPDRYGSYVFYFRFRDQRWCVDATPETDRLGRLINHGKKNANIAPRPLEIDGQPHIAFFAIREIKAGEELLYDYGDRSEASLKNNPWLKL